LSYVSNHSPKFSGKSTFSLCISPTQKQIDNAVLRDIVLFFMTTPITTKNTSYFDTINIDDLEAVLCTQHIK